MSDDKTYDNTNNTSSNTSSPCDRCYDVISIDAWGNKEEGYEWNTWYKIDTFDGNINNEQEVLNFFLDMIKESWHDKLYIYDDQYNLVLKVIDTDEPIYAIAYGDVL